MCLRQKEQVAGEGFYRVGRMGLVALKMVRGEIKVEEDV